jgi:LmbE family N-acetylglucosaminyl deacetylase
MARRNSVLAASPSAGLLARLADPQRPEMEAGNVALVVAHPNDETIALGAQLPRMRGVGMIHVTDGAPEDGENARRHGFATPALYAKARRRELDAALALAGVRADRATCLGVADQAAARTIASIARRLGVIFEAWDIDVAVTHAFEGGHPDHDAVACAVHAAVRTSARPIEIVEAPFYRAGSDGDCRFQSFLPAARSRETVIDLTAEERTRKQRMLAAHESQAAVLSRVDLERELLRPAPTYDFSALPNGGRVLWPQVGAGLSAPRWKDYVARALRDLGLGPR